MKMKLATCLLVLLAVDSVAVRAWAEPADPWAAITERAEKAKPGAWSADRAALESRDKYKALYATYKDWQPPEVTAAPGKLTGLQEKPTKPRFELTEKVWPEKPGDASICLWEDDKTAAYSFSIDDNLAGDVPFWLELSKKYGGLKITWNLITLNIDGAFDKGRGVQAGTWAFWQGMVDKGFHVTSHSVTHVADPVTADGWPGPAWEVVESVRALDSHLTGRKTKLFAYPGSAIKEFNVSGSWRPVISKYVASARGGSGIPINMANQTDYYDIRTTSNPLGAVPPGKPAFASADLTLILNKSADRGLSKYYRGWASTFIHGVNGGKGWGEDPFTKSHVAVFEWVTSHREDLWIGFLDDVALYGQERDTATIQTVDSSDQKITFNLNCQMDPAIFNYPLTVKVCLPAGWKNAQAMQGDAAVDVTMLRNGDRTYALVKALPDGRNVVITPK